MLYWEYLMGDKVIHLHAPAKRKEPPCKGTRLMPFSPRKLEAGVEDGERKVLPARGVHELGIVASILVQAPILDHPIYRTSNKPGEDDQCPQSGRKRLCP